MLNRVHSYPYAPMVAPFASVVPSGSRMPGPSDSYLCHEYSRQSLLPGVYLYASTVGSYVRTHSYRLSLVRTVLACVPVFSFRRFGLDVTLSCTPSCMTSVQTDSYRYGTSVVGARGPRSGLGVRPLGGSWAVNVVIRFSQPYRLPAFPPSIARALHGHYMVARSWRFLDVH